MKNARVRVRMLKNGGKPSMKRFGRNRIFLFVLSALLFSPLSFAEYVVPVTHPDQAKEFHRVIRVSDGDTLRLERGKKIRLIGIDTPEIEHPHGYARSKRDRRLLDYGGEQAADFARTLLEGKKVRLEFDAVRTDKYGRTLAYVFLEDGTFVNAEIVKEGYAETLTIPPNVKYWKLFQRLQAEAREAKKGLWKDLNLTQN